MSTKFDLICDGSELSDTSYGKEKPVTHRYRIDTEQMRWCWEECKNTHPIEKLSVDSIVFFDEPDGGFKASISRVDGTYSRSYKKSFWFYDSGTCKPAPFSGMPEPKF